ncbi:MAG: hypothetical protein R2786_05385 [Flavobacteriaceae bacterium]
MYKKISSALIMLLFFALFITPSKLFSQNCNVDLKVEKNRNFKSADENGVVFDLVLTNNSAQKDQFSISQNFLKLSCSSEIHKSTSANVILTTEILDGNSKSISEEDFIVLNAGQSYKFKVKLGAAEKNDYQKWSCLEIKATSQNCKTVASSTTLSIFLPDPLEE